MSERGASGEAHDVPYRWLVDHHDGVLTGQRLASLAEHLGAGCARCEHDLAGIAATTAALAVGALPAPPGAAVKRAVGLFARARLGAVFGTVRRVVATLLFDEWMEPAPALRGTEGRVRRMLFGVGEAEIFLTMVSDRSGWTLEGQYLAADDGAPSGRFRLIRGERDVGTVPVGDLGRFRFGKLKPGIYSMEGEVDEQSLAVPAFVLD